MEEKLIARSYKFPQSTIDQLERLDKAIKGMTMRDIVVEAISIMAAEHGVAERGDDSLSMSKLQQKLDDQNKTIKLLCKTCLKYEFAETGEEMTLNPVNKLVAKAKKTTSDIGEKDLWTAVKKGLPKALKDSTNFKLYLATLR